MFILINYIIITWIILYVIELQKNIVHINFYVWNALSKLSALIQVDTYR